LGSIIPHLMNWNMNILSIQMPHILHHYGWNHRVYLMTWGLICKKNLILVQSERFCLHPKLITLSSSESIAISIANTCNQHIEHGDVKQIVYIGINRVLIKVTLSLGLLLTPLFRSLSEVRKVIRKFYSIWVWNDETQHLMHKGRGNYSSWKKERVGSKQDETQFTTKIK
jgi:hypothetical protein